MKIPAGKVSIVPSWVAQVGMCRAIIEGSDNLNALKTAWEEIFKAASLADEFVKIKGGR